MPEIKAKIRHLYDLHHLWNALSASPLLYKFETLWRQLSQVYYDELSGLAYTSIPQSDEIVGSMREILGVFI